MTIDHLAEMLTLQLELQHRYGHNFREMTLPERVDFIKEMQQAAVQELGEVLNEISWKSWTSGQDFINEAALMAELSDTWQFVTNMWFAALPHATPESLAVLMKAYLLGKLKINDRRHDDGYDGVSTKCPGCGRALDDPTTACYVRGDQGWCSQDDSDVNLIKVSVIQSTE